MSSSALRTTLAALAAATLLASAAAADGTQTPAAGHPRYEHFFVIVLENHSRDSVIGSPDLPKLNALARAHGIARRYYGVTHPSQPNYVAMISGDLHGVVSDNPVTPPIDARNLVDQLEPAHSWTAYMESAEGDGYLGNVAPGTQALYAAKHNPFVAFADVRNRPERLARIKPYASFARDMKAGSVADFVYIVPNQCHDMHGGIRVRIADGDGTPCPYSVHADDANDRALKKAADDFVATTVEQIRATRAWNTTHSAIIIVADESDLDSEATAQNGWADVTGCCDSPTYAAGSPVVNPLWKGGTFGGGVTAAVVITSHGGHVVSDRSYNHYSLLTTIEDNWNLGHLGHAGDAAGGVVPMDDLLVAP